LAVAISFGLAASRVRAILSRLAEFPVWWILLALTVMSAAWSGSMIETTRAGTWLCSAMILGAYLGVRFTLLEHVRLVAVVLVILTVLSIALAIVEPKLGVDVGPHAGSWRGAFITKNAFGRMMAFGFAALLVLSLRDRVFRGPALLGLATTSALLVLSDSRTAMMIAAILVAFAAASGRVARLKPSHGTIIWMFVIVCLGVILAAVMTGTAARTRPGDPDLLTGRPRLWAASLLMVLRSPILGYGYQDFWNGPQDHFLAVWRVVGWSPPHAHNGFLDVTLDLGIVGLILVLLLLARIAKFAWDALNADPRSPGALWACSIVLFTLLTNLTETTLLRGNVFWVLLCSAGVALTPPRPSGEMRSSQ
jgi:O-antigen ligase